LLALGATALTATACTRFVDMDKVREDVGQGVAERFGLEVAGVECPETRESKADDHFECVATTTGGATITARVFQLQDGEVTWSFGETRGLVDRERLAADIRAGLLAQGFDARVDCGEGFGDTAPGESFRCDARGDERRATVVVTVQDREGRVGWSLEEEAPAS